MGCAFRYMFTLYRKNRVSIKVKIGWVNFFLWLCTSVFFILLHLVAYIAVEGGFFLPFYCKQATGFDRDLSKEFYTFRLSEFNSLKLLTDYAKNQFFNSLHYGWHNVIVCMQVRGHSSSIKVTKCKWRKNFYSNLHIFGLLTWIFWKLSADVWIYLT